MQGGLEHLAAAPPILQIKVDKTGSGMAVCCT
jgi:hypothetical protein